MDKNVFKKVTHFDSNSTYFQIIKSELKINRSFKRSQLFTNKYIRNEVQKHINIDLNCDQSLDFSHYFAKTESLGFVCKDCCHQEINELNIFKHIYRHFIDYQQKSTNKTNPKLNSNQRQTQESDEEFQESNDKQIIYLTEEVIEVLPQESQNMKRKRVLNTKRQETVVTDNKTNKDNEWQVLDEWRPNQDSEDSSDAISLSSDASTNCSEALRRLTPLSDFSQNSDKTSGDPNSKRQKFSKEEPPKHLCNWLDCHKSFNHKRCFQKHFDKHLVNEKGHKWDQTIDNYSESYFTFDGIEDYIEIIEENDSEKYFCRFNDCDYHSLWSYQLVIHIRSEHTFLWPPFRCDWKDCHKIVSSKDAFRHRVSHFG